MTGLSDELLVEELKNRLEAKEKACHDLRGLAKRLEDVNRKLIESEGLKSNFLSNIRNEINNPLAVVLSMCTFILSSPDELDRDTLVSSLRLIHKESFSLDFQLRNIFTAAELEAGESNMNITSTDIDSLVGSTVDAFRPLASEKKLTLDLCITECLRQDPFHTDHEKLELVMMNIIANAVEFSREGGSVEIRAMRNDSDLVFTVKDSGIGIDGKEFDAIFERFRQLESGSTKPHPGHGLGLSITREMLRVLGGSVTVESEKDRGARFTVTLPESDAGCEADVMSAGGADFFVEDGEGFLKL